jgi:hypothetical protein
MTRNILTLAYDGDDPVASATIRPRRIETVVLASNEDGLSFAARHGFVEFDRYVLDGETATYVGLYLALRA